MFINIKCRIFANDRNLKTKIMANTSLFSKITNNRLVSNLIIIAIVAILALIGYNKYMALKTDLEISNQNNVALADSLRTSKNKVKDLVYSKSVLVAEHQTDINKLNKELANEAKLYEGKIHELTVIISQIKSDTVFINDTELVEFPDGSKGLGWEYSKIYDNDNSRFLSGISTFKINGDMITPLNTTITKDIINFKITLGLRTNDGLVEAFASSNYPGFETGDLSSIIINPKTHPALTKFTKQKKWNFGVYAGYGVTANLSTSVVTVGPQLGVGVMYNFFSF